MRASATNNSTATRTPVMKTARELKGRVGPNEHPKVFLLIV